MNKKILDLFCGVGGLSLGFEKAGFESFLGVDFWEEAINTYNRNRKNGNGVSRDVSEYRDEELKKMKKTGIKGVIGGPPCQGFSMVGTREKKDPRNNLYLQFFRFVEIIKPSFFLIENVKGLLNLEKGYFKKDIINRFSKLNYNVNYKLLKASDFGIPQNRERVFFIGLKKNIYNDDFFDFSSLKKETLVSAKDALSDLANVDPLNSEKKIKHSLKPETKYQEVMRENLPDNQIFNHVITNHTKKTIEIISKIPDGGNIKNIDSKYYKVRNYNSAFKRMDSKKPSITVDCGHRNYFHYSKNRVPTVREAARLQSFPDNFIFTGSKTSQYTQVGNAVPPLLAFKIAENIKKIC